jgi:hypothetical protein
MRRVGTKSTGRAAGRQAEVRVCDDAITIAQPDNMVRCNWWCRMQALGMSPSFYIDPPATGNVGLLCVQMCARH